MAAQQTTIALQDLTGDYQVDPTHSRLGFVTRHAMVTKVRGHFNDFEGSLHLDADDPSKASAEIRVKVASISTSQDQRDEHLRNADFFDADNHPEMVFRSTSAEQVDDDTYRLTGDLTIKGVTRPVTLELDYTGAAKDPWGNLRVGFEGRADVNRKDWGITWNSPLETGGFLVGEKIRLELDISAVKLPADA
jgi:polyisoprenoid-binding protein YceI